MTGSCQVGIGELLLLVLLALLLVGRSDLPALARRAGRLAWHVRKAAVDLQDALTREVDASREPPPPDPGDPPA